MRQHRLQPDRTWRAAPLGFLTDGDFILKARAAAAGGSAQNASAASAITGPAPVLSFAKWAEVSGRTRSRK